VKQWEVDMFRGMSCLDYNVWKGEYIGGMTTTTTTTTIIITWWQHTNKSYLFNLSSQHSVHYNWIRIKGRILILLHIHFQFQWIGPVQYIILLKYYIVNVSLLSITMSLHKCKILVCCYILIVWLVLDIHTHTHCNVGCPLQGVCTGPLIYVCFI